MKLMTLSAVLVPVILSAAPVIDPTSVSVVQDPATHAVTVSYRLTGEPAVVTFDVFTNDVAVAPGDLAVAWGDVYRCLGPSDTRVRTFTWQADKSSIGAAFAADQARLVVKAWATNAPPAYAVIDLLVPSIRRYYESIDQLPDGGLANDIYKCSRLVLRRIPAKDIVWRMGDAKDSYTAWHKVLLTDDYYLTIYEVTKEQWERLTTGSSSSSEAEAKLPYGGNFSSQFYPNKLRGSTWPENRHDGVTDDSPLGQMRLRTGFKFDLPTMAEWEYACRAGTGGDRFCDFDDLGKYAWFGDADKKIHEVGLKEPNPWGLYDVYGNVFELTVESHSGFYGLGSKIVSDTTTVTTNQFGPSPATTTGTKRGGYSGTGANGNYSALTSHCVDTHTYTSSQANTGARLMCAAVVPYEEGEGEENK